MTRRRAPADGAPPRRWLCRPSYRPGLEKREKLLRKGAMVGTTARKQAGPAPWWLQDGTEECPHCGQLYHLEAERRCQACDAPGCPHCLGEPHLHCPECPEEPAG